MKIERLREKRVEEDGTVTYGLFNVTMENGPEFLRGRDIVLDGNYFVIGAAVVFLGVLALALS
jgi:hypothetical protein